MTRFAYRALDVQGELVEGEMESPDRASLVETLRRKGYRPLHTEPRRASRASSSPRRTGLRLTVRRRATAGGADLVLFTRELATLLGAGLPLDQALSTIAGQADRPAVAGITRTVRDRVRGGASFADALTAHPELFPPHYVGLVRAGEAGGSLASVLAELADSLEHARALNQEIRSALNYPILVLLVAGLSILVLLLGVIPEFEPLFAGAGGALPVTAAAVLAVSQGLRSYWWAMPAVLLAIALAWRVLRADAGVRARFDAAILRLPLLGPLMHKIEATRFCRTLGTLLANGVEVVPALQMSSRTLANRRLADAVEQVAPRLRRGEGLCEPLRNSGTLPPLAARLVEIGEASGELPRMLLTVARLYDEEIRRETGRLVSLLVPAVTLVIGLVVFAVIGAILSAILTSYELPF